MPKSIKRHPLLFIQRLQTLHLFTGSEYVCSLPPRKPLLLAKTETPLAFQEVARILLSSYCCTEIKRKLGGIEFTGHSASCKQRGWGLRGAHSLICTRICFFHTRWTNPDAFTRVHKLAEKPPTCTCKKVICVNTHRPVPQLPVYSQKIFCLWGCFLRWEVFSLTF